MDRKTFFENELLRCADVVSRGGVIAYPTDTVWGIGCDSSDSGAVEKVFAIKRRSDAKALISLVADEEMLEAVVGPLSAEVRELVRSDRPTTVISNIRAGWLPRCSPPTAVPLSGLRASLSRSSFADSSDIR